MRVPSQYRKRLHRLLKDVHRVLQREGIPHWMDGDTLLGAKRNGGRIPHDDNVDLGALVSDILALRPCLKHLHQLGYEVSVRGDMVKIHVPNSAQGEFGNATLNLFFYERADGRYQLGIPEQRERWPGCWHAVEDLFPLHDLPFDELTLPGPHRPEPYLDRMYPGWPERAVVDEPRNGLVPVVTRVL